MPALPKVQEAIMISQSERMAAVSLLAGCQGSAVRLRWARVRQQTQDMREGVCETCPIRNRCALMLHMDPAYARSPLDQRTPMRAFFMGHAFRGEACVLHRNPVQSVTDFECTAR